jgi:hypothetical protein
VGEIAESGGAVGEPLEPNTSGTPAAAPRPSSARAPTPGRAGAAGRTRSEAATLVCAVSVAVALGMAFGGWLSARLAAAASATPPAPVRLLPDISVGQKASATSAETVPGLADYNDTSSAADVTAPSPDSFGPRGAAEASRTKTTRTTDEAGAAKRDAVETAKDVSPSAKPAERPGGTQDVKSKAGQGKVVPCALYASSSSLTVRSGGAAALVLGGPGDGGRVEVTTPDWSDIAVFPEGRAAGNGWVRYSVRSVSKRAGVYRVHLKTPCGSQTIPVTVKGH